MKKAPLLFIGLAVVSILLIFSTNLSYNFILSGAVASGNQPLPAATISVEFVTGPTNSKQLYYEPSHFPGGGYDLNFPAKNNSEVYLYYEKMGFGTFKKKKMLEGSERLKENSYVQIDLPIAHLFNFNRYDSENGEFIGSFNRKKMILFRKKAELSAKRDTVDLVDITFFEETTQLHPFPLNIDGKKVNAHWYGVTFSYKSQRKKGYVLYEDKELVAKP